MTMKTKVMDTIFDIVILTQLVHSEPIKFKENSIYFYYLLSELIQINRTKNNPISFK